MVKCAVCDAELQPEQKTCHVCGSNVEAVASAGPVLAASIRQPTSLPPLPPLHVPNHSDSIVSAEEQECPSCGRTFGSDYTDEFCPCGTELQPRTTSSAPTSGVATTPRTTPAPLPPPAAMGATPPKAGTACLVVYSETKPRVPVLYVPINKDVLMIGRQDAVRGDFPDLDLGSLLNETLAKKVSRRHAEVLRARDSQTYTLRAFPGNTGTQVGKELAAPDQRYPLTDGVPIVLGGVVWMKFEVIK